MRIQALGYFIVLVFSLPIVSCYSQDTSFYNISPTDTFPQQITNVDTVYIEADTIALVDTVTVFVPIPRYDETSIGFNLMSIFWLPKYNSLGLADDDLLSSMNNISSSAASYAASVNVKIIRNSWLISPGVGFVNLREKIELEPQNILYFRTSYSQTDTIDVHYQVVGNDTVWEYVTQINQYERDDSSELSNPYINNYVYIETPILVGYSWKDYRNRFTVDLQTGIALGFLINKNHKNIYLSDTQRLNKIDKSFKNNIHLSFILGADLNYKISDHIKISSGMFYKQYISTFYKDDFLFNLKPSLLNIKLGIQYVL